MNKKFLKTLNITLKTIIILSSFFFFTIIISFLSFSFWALKYFWKWIITVENKTENSINFEIFFNKKSLKFENIWKNEKKEISIKENLENDGSIKIISDKKEQIISHYTEKTGEKISKYIFLMIKSK